VPIRTAYGRARAALAVALGALALVAALGVPDETSAWPQAAAAARSAKHCKRSQVRVKLAYARHKGGRKHHRTGCAPRAAKLPAAFPAALAKAQRLSRRHAAQLAPRRIVRLMRRRAARRVSAADKTTDAALGRALGGAKTARTARRSRARAANITHENETRTVQGPSGTHTIAHVVSTTWDDQEPMPGSDLDGTIETTSDAGGGSSREVKRVRMIGRIAQCPDANGIGRGTFKYSNKEYQLTSDGHGGNGARVIQMGFDAEVTAHFGDNGKVARADVVGGWSWSSSGNDVGGRINSNITRSGNDFVDNISTNVTTASDFGSALAGNFLGPLSVYPPFEFIQELVRGIERRAANGCVSIRPRDARVHVAPGGSVTVAARLLDRKGNGFNGPISATAGYIANSGRVTPPKTQADPEASFTYTAGRSPVKGDYVLLEHTSKRGITRLPVPVDYEGFTYRILSASLGETSDGDGPAQPGFAACGSPTAHETNAMSLGQQGELASLQGFDDSSEGYLTAPGTLTAATTVHGCNVSTDPPSPCTRTGSANIDDERVEFYVRLPSSGPAQVEWTLREPVAGLGTEGDGSCFVQQFSWAADPDTLRALGTQTEPREKFEDGGPHTVSIHVPIDHTNSDGTHITDTQDHSITFQRVHADGTPY
jgi:hypothetical protein